MSEPRSFNIDELRCNAFTRAGKHFDLARHEVFMAETDGFAYPHRHNYYMLLLATSGNGSQLIDFKAYDVKPGRLFLMSPGMIHAWERDEGLKGYVLFFTADFFTQRYNMNKLYEFPFYSSSYEHPFVDLDEPNAEACCTLLEQMLEVYRENKTGMMSMLRSYVNVILCRAQQVYEDRFQANPSEAPQLRDIIQRFEQLIDQHYSETRLVKDYAKLLHLTPNYLNAVAKEKTGQSAGHLIRHRVMLEAKRMLAHENRTVGEISDALNFKDAAYFCRFFKKYEATTPERFRKQLFSRAGHR